MGASAELKLNLTVNSLKVVQVSTTISVHEDLTLQGGAENKAMETGVNGNRNYSLKNNCKRRVLLIFTYILNFILILSPSTVLSGHAYCTIDV